MTGQELKQFVKDQGWTADQAAENLRIGRRTLFENYQKDEITPVISLAIELYKLVPNKKRPF